MWLCELQVSTDNLFFFLSVKKAIELKSRGVKMLPSKDSSHKNSVCELLSFYVRLHTPIKGRTGVNGMVPNSVL